MTRITCLIGLFIFSCIGASFGQARKNPFELLHRKGEKPSLVKKPDRPAKVAKEEADTTVIRIDTTATDSIQTVQTPEDSSANMIDLFADPKTEMPPETPIGPEAEEDASGEERIPPGELTGEETVTDTAGAGTVAGDTIAIQEVIPVIPPPSVKREKISGAFLALIFLGILLLLTIIVNINRKMLYQIYRASLNENYSALLYRERKHSAFNYLYTIAYVIFFINAGLFIYLVQFLDIWYHSATFALWVLILFPVTIYLVRHIVMHMLAYVFPVSKELNQFNFNIIVFNVMIGLFLIPVNLFLAFGPDLLHLPIVYTSIVAIGLFYLFRQLRGVLIATPLLSNNLFLFFIYLCTVEILPLAVIFKLLA